MKAETCIDDEFAREDEAVRRGMRNDADMVAREQVANARIWVDVNGSPVKITLRPGQELNWAHYGRDEEGYSQTHYQWAWTGTILCETVNFDGSDCDGRTSSHGKYFTTPDKFQANAHVAYDERNDYSGIRFPEWQKLSRRQRDYAAEAAGY